MKSFGSIFCIVFPCLSFLSNAASIVNAFKSEAMKLQFELVAEGQGGLLDVALSPEYQKNIWVYFTYVKDIDGQGATVLSRSKLIENDFFNGKSYWFLNQQLIHHDILEVV